MNTVNIADEEQQPCGRFLVEMCSWTIDDNILRKINGHSHLFHIGHSFQIISMSMGTFLKSVLPYFDMEMPLMRSAWEFIENQQFIDGKHHTFIAIYVVPFLWFYFYGYFFYLVDTYSSEKFRGNYKVQTEIIINQKQYWDAFIISLFNWLILALPYLAFLSYVFIPWLVPVMPPIPTVGVFFRDMIVYVAVEEVMFYFSHKLLHTSRFYAPIHKFHHKFTAPFAIAAVYAHPIEHMVSNVIPVSVGSLLMKSHPILPCFWGVLALFNTMSVHSGYDFSSFCFFFPLPYFHDWHHEKFTENFGATQILDYVFQTNKQFLLAMKRGEIMVPNHKKTVKKG